jgi:hypothetical protein
MTPQEDWKADTVTVGQRTDRIASIGPRRLSTPKHRVIAALVLSLATIAVFAIALLDILDSTTPRLTPHIFKGQDHSRSRPRAAAAHPPRTPSPMRIHRPSPPAHPQPPKASSPLRVEADPPTVALPPPTASPEPPPPPPEPAALSSPPAQTQPRPTATTPAEEFGL